MQHSCCGYTPLALLKNTPPSSRRRAVIDASKSSEKKKNKKNSLRAGKGREKEEGTLYNHIQPYFKMVA